LRNGLASARLLLQFDLRIPTIVIRRVAIVDDRLETLRLLANFAWIFERRFSRSTTDVLAIP
jgi:hypothetical protein